jgi:predicted esterase
MIEEHELIVARRARYYTLGQPSAADEVWIALHGYGQLAEEFAAAFPSLVTEHRAVVVPEALNRYYKEKAGHRGSHAETPVGTTWMTRRYREAEILDQVAYLDQLVGVVAPAGARICLLGFSQGAATAWRWVTFGATRFARVVAWAGALPVDLPLDQARERIPEVGVDVVHGQRDGMISWVDVDGQVGRLREAGIVATVTTFDGGHRIDRAALLDVAGRPGARA